MLQLISWELCLIIFIIPWSSEENIKWVGFVLAALFAYLTYEQGAAFTGINF